MRPLTFALTVLFLLTAVVGQVPAGEGPPAAPDPYLTDWQLGEQFVEQGRYREAIAAYQRFIEEMPKAVGARISMGYAYEQLGEKEKAYQLYRDAVSIYPDFAMDYINMEAGSNPGIADAMCGVGKVFLEQGRIFHALEVFEDAVRVSPDHVEAHFRLGVAYLVLDVKKSALEEYEFLRSLDGEKASELQLMIAGDSPALSP